jgi:peroxiredoxin
MTRTEPIPELAPDFESQDTRGGIVRLSSFRGRVVVLAFLRGFAWPYCRAQLARLRDDYAEFTSRGAEVVAIGPNGPGEFGRYWRAQQIPFIGIPDPRHKVARLYRQEVNLFKLGRMPLVAVIDAMGFIQYTHRGDSMADIPENGVLLQVIECIQAHSRDPARPKSAVRNSWGGAVRQARPTRPQPANDLLDRM